MPIILHQALSPEGEIGIWKIEEPEEWFLEKLELAPAEARQLSGIKGRRRTEWLAVRQLVHDMSGREQRGAFIKDDHGKPHLKGAAWFMSISHSHELAAAIAAPRPVGIDIQFLVGKIERLANRYMRPEEMASLDAIRRIEHLHIYWGAKEALYKAYGRRQIDFCQNLLVEPFDFDFGQGYTRAEIVKEDYHEYYDVFYQQHGEYILVYVMMRLEE